MSDRIHVDFTTVYSQTAALRSQVAAEIDCMEGEYQQIQSMLDTVDSATNFALKEAMEINRQKTQLTAMTLDKLLSFMSNSTMQVETTESKIKSVFESILGFFKGGVSRAGRGAGRAS